VLSGGDGHVLVLGYSDELIYARFDSTYVVWLGIPSWVNEAVRIVVTPRERSRGLAPTS
jgi:hypothetical protein